MSSRYEDLGPAEPATSRYEDLGPAEPVSSRYEDLGPANTVTSGGHSSVRATNQGSTISGAAQMPDFSRTKKRVQDVYARNEGAAKTGVNRLKDLATKTPTEKPKGFLAELAAQPQAQALMGVAETVFGTSGAALAPITGIIDQTMKDASGSDIVGHVSGIVAESLMPIAPGIGTALRSLKATRMAKMGKPMMAAAEAAQAAKPSIQAVEQVPITPKAMPDRPPEAIELPGGSQRFEDLGPAEPSQALAVRPKALEPEVTGPVGGRRTPDDVRSAEWEEAYARASQEGTLNEALEPPGLGPRPASKYVDPNVFEPEVMEGTARSLPESGIRDKAANNWVVEQKEGILKEVQRDTKRLRDERNRLLDEIERDPSNPGNGQIQKAVADVDAKMEAQYQRLSKEVTDPREWMSNAQMEHHLGPEAPPVRVAALKAPDGRILRGKPGDNHGMVWEGAGEPSGKLESGFVDETGAFVSSEAAEKVAPRLAPRGTHSPEYVQSKINAMLEEDPSGFSMGPDGRRFAPKSGFSVEVRKLNGPEEIADALNRGKKVGGWKDPATNEFVTGEIEHVLTEKAAIKLGAKHDQKAVFNFATMQDVPVPTKDGPTEMHAGGLTGRQLREGFERLQDPGDALGARATLRPEEAEIMRHFGDDPDPASKFLTQAERKYTDIVDRTFPLGKVTRAAVGKKASKTFPITRDPQRLAAMATGSEARAEVFIGEDGPFRWGADGEAIPTGTPALKTIIAPLQGRIPQFKAYMESKKALEASEYGINLGLDLDAARAVVANASPEVVRASELTAKYFDDVLQYYADSGPVSPAHLQAMRDRYHDYMPSMKAADQKLGTGSKGAMAPQPANIFKRLTGGDQKKKDPLLAMIEYTQSLVRAADLNRVSQSLAELAEEFPSNLKGLVDKIETTTPTPTSTAAWLSETAMAKGHNVTAEAAAEVADLLKRDKLSLKDDIISTWRGDKMESYKLAPELAQAMRSLSPQEMGLVVKMISVPAKTLRMGVTRNPVFPPINMFRDVLDATLQNKYGFNPITDTLHGFGASIKGILGGPRSELKREFMRSGAGYSGLGRGHGPSSKRIARDIVPRTKRGHIAYEIAHPMFVYQRLIDAFEESTRLGVLRRAKKAGQSTLESGHSAATTTVDFRQVGAEMRGLNSMTAFLGPFTAGVDTSVMKFRKNPKGMAIKGLVAVSLPSLYFRIAAEGDQELQDAQKSEAGLNYFHVRVGKDIYKLPKPFLNGQVFGTSFEAAYDKWKRDDPEALGRFVKGLMNQALAMPVPTVLQTSYALWANKRPVFGSPIVPKTRTELDPEFQTAPSTTSRAKKIGGAINVSPAKIDFAVGQTLGTTGTDIMRATSPENTSPKFFGRLRHNQEQQSGPQEQFWEKYGKAKRAKLTYEHIKDEDPARVESYRAKRPELAQYARLQAGYKKMAKLRKRLEEAKKMNVSREERSERVRAVQAQMTEVAREAIR